MEEPAHRGHDRIEKAHVQSFGQRVVRLAEVEDDDAPAGRENAPHLDERGLGICNVPEAVSDGDHVESLR